MKKLLVAVSLLLHFSIINAQKIHLTLFGGISNYQGDLQSKRFTFQQANAAFGIGGLYDFTDKLHLRANVTFGKVAGSDVLSSTYGIRNLSFSSPLTDVHLGLEYDVLNPSENSLVPYVFTGISYFHFNPSALDSTGKKVYLQPLGTEGQGFFLGREKYKLNSFAVPFGGGVKLALSENIKVRFEFGMRKTFTDYLDDVSTTYADENELLLNNGPQAVDLAFRGDENKSGISYPPVNTVRGNPKSKDWYYFTGLGVSFRLFPGSSNGGSPGRTKTGCPVNIY
jgi:opacity protein-like surface antigen